MAPAAPSEPDGPIVAPATPATLPEVARFVAAQQVDPIHHIAYLGTEPDGIAAELTTLEPLGLDAVLVARRGGRLVGVLAADRSDDPPRVWWCGPFVASGEAFDAVADALLRAGRALLPPEVTQEELAPDRRNGAVAAFARRHGFEPGEASAALTTVLADHGPGLPAGRARRGPDDVRLAPLDDGTRAAVAALHDRLFAGTHTPGDRLDRAPDRVVLVATRDGRMLGYIAAERQADGAGYLDFLAVDERARGQGIGRRLVVAACEWLRDDLECTWVHLTVREGNAAARRLYADLGFVAERVLQPWTRGFRPD
jgi:ribosomal protein S18 acetylase RimI-like enzyme